MMQQGESLPKRERYARTPDSVLKDRRLGAMAKLVYAAMARESVKRGECWAGQRKIAGVIGISQAQVSRRIAELIGCAHVERINLVRGRRSGYRLLSNIFQPRERKAPAGPRVTSTVAQARRFAELSRG